MMMVLFWLLLLRITSERTGRSFRSRTARASSTLRRRFPALHRSKTPPPSTLPLLYLSREEDREEKNAGGSFSGKIERGRNWQSWLYF
jgi:hypothetical protein